MTLVCIPVLPAKVFGHLRCGDGLVVVLAGEGVERWWRRTQRAWEKCDERSEDLQVGQLKPAHLYAAQQPKGYNRIDIASISHARTTVSRDWSPGQSVC